MRHLNRDAPSFSNRQLQQLAATASYLRDLNRRPCGSCAACDFPLVRSDYLEVAASVGLLLPMMNATTRFRESIFSDARQGRGTKIQFLVGQLCNDCTHS